MHAATITSILLAMLPFGGLASPTPIDANPLVKRADKCEGENRVIYTRWNIWVDRDVDWNESCGGGCLDNIRGRCGGSVTDWGCERNADGQGYYHFNTVTTCSGSDMSAALNACLGGRSVSCST